MSDSTIVVTGASGFLGRAVVAAATKASYNVRALVRPGPDQHTIDWARAAGVDLHPVALKNDAELVAALRGAAAVIHVAAAKTGHYERQYEDTVKATQALVDAMHLAEVPRLVGIGSFAVYDYQNLASGAVLDEDSPIETQTRARDAYAQTKLLQEQVFQRFAEQGGELVLLRPGIIYGPGQCWQFCLGRALGADRWLWIGPEAEELPWTYVDNCAAAAVLAAGAPQAAGAVINIVDDERLGRSEFVDKLNSFDALRKRVIRFPWWLLKMVAAMVSGINRLAGNRLPVPGLLQLRTLNVQFKPLRYSNARAKHYLGWQPEVGVDEALRRSAGA